jgi:hypothetical protein
MQDQGMERRSSWGCSGCVATRPHPRPGLGSRFIFRPSTDVHCFNQRMMFEDEHSDPDRMAVHGVDIDIPVHSANPAAFLPRAVKVFQSIWVTNTTVTPASLENYGAILVYSKCDHPNGLLLSPSKGRNEEVVDRRVYETVHALLRNRAEHARLQAWGARLKATQPQRTTHSSNFKCIWW